MQYLMISETDTMQSLSRIVGSQNMDDLLSENGLRRTPKIGKQYYDNCRQVIANTPQDVTPERKAALLNGLTNSQEVFEKACLQDEDEWKVFSTYHSFVDALKVPETMVLPYSYKVIGSSSNADSEVIIGSGSANSVADPVSSGTYRTVINQLTTTGTIDPGVFNKVNTARSSSVQVVNQTSNGAKIPQYAYNLPWGKIQIYSSLFDEVVDIPAYPEDFDTGRKAQYTSMPDIIYQYEPWIVYQDSGPREQSLDFHLHRDMWTGNHLDGNANNLIRFCEANTFPKINGSAVNSGTVKIFIDGYTFISGVLTDSRTHWSGPIGLDNWPLEFTLSLSIQEVAPVALTCDVVRNLPLIGFGGTSNSSRGGSTGLVSRHGRAMR